jgi:hypothetical protein
MTAEEFRMTNVGLVSAQRVIESAVKQSGVSGFESGSFIEGLEVLGRSIPVGEPSAQGAALIERMMTDALAVRFQIEGFLAAHPDLEQRPVKRPIFVCGMPRTGTTMAVNLLSQDPRHRSILKWEISEPVPPAAPGALKTDPRCIAKKAVQQRRVAAGELTTNIHFEWADEPTECVFVHQQDFKSAGWDALLPMPEYSEFLMSCDLVPTYRWHLRVLQALQSNNSGRWLLKAPSHALFAEALLQVYPDARLVWTHRDPLQAVPSLASLVAGAHKRFRPEPDIDWIRRFYPGQLAEHTRRMMAVDARLPGQVYHLMYRDLMKKPVETMQALYAWLEEPFTAQTEASITGWFRANPQSKHGEHRYSLEDFGIRPEAVRELFGAYSARFGF